MGDRLMDDGTEHSLGGKHHSGIFGSIASRDNLSQDGGDGLSTKHNNPKDSEARTLSRKMKKPKMKTAFDEYEQRGGVLEGYEDLNDESEDGFGRDDHVLSQLYANQSDSNSISNTSYNL